MAPIILPRDWLAVHPSYAALDEHLRWTRSRRGGRMNLDTASGQILYHRDLVSGDVLPTTVYRNILDYLDHVFTNNGTGPSLLSQVLEMLPTSALKSLRSVTKSIGTAAIKVICKTIRLPTDSFTDETGGTILLHFVDLINSTRNAALSSADPPAAWLLNTKYVKELYFYPDPVNEEKLIKLYTNFKQQLEAVNIFGQGTAVRATLQDGRNFLKYSRDEVKQQYWYGILQLIEDCTNLELFTWDSKVWQPVELLQVLAFNCPKLTKLQLHFAEPLLEGGLSQPPQTPQLKHKSASELEQITSTLPLDLEIHLKVAVRRDEYILPVLLHLGAFTRKVDTLIIDRSASDDGFSAWDQGWNTETPLKINGQLVSLTTEALFEVRCLWMISIGNKSRYVMPLLDTTGLRELCINGCLNVEFILEPLVRTAKYLTSVSVIFVELHAEYVAEPRRYHHLRVQDTRHALDFVRSGNFTLTDLLLRADFADPKRTPKSSSFLVPDLWFAIQAHMATLVRLTVLNGQDDFRVTDIEELGRCALRLQELRIQSRLGEPLYGMPTPRTEGLGYSLERALLAFRTHKTLRVFAIIKSYSANINPDENPEHRKLVLNNNLQAVVNSINHGVPIKLFTFMEEPWRQPATCHFYYNKTPFEPDVTWGVYPSPLPPVRDDAEYFKGFEFHEKILGLKGQAFYEQEEKMLHVHGNLVKELQLWHPETKRGGATFSPERIKLPSDTIKTIQQPIPPDTYAGDFGDPRWQENDPVILAERLARGLSSNGSFLDTAARNPAGNRRNTTGDWAVAKNPNAKKYYVYQNARKTSWENPNRIKVSRGEKLLRISEEDRNNLFGKELPSYSPMTLSESEFNAMTGRDLYHWEELHSLLDEESINKLKILERPSTDSNREEQYAVLDEYIPKNQSWEIDNPVIFVQALHALCARQRVFILKAAIINGIVIPEPITYARFWAKPQNDQLVWLILNGYVNSRQYPLLTLSYALQPLKIILREEETAAGDVEADAAYAQWSAYFNGEVHDIHVPHAISVGKILPKPIDESTFNEIADPDLYYWAVTRNLLLPVSGDDQVRLLNIQMPAAVAIPSYIEMLAETYRGEILSRAAQPQNGLVTLQIPTEETVRSLTDRALYHWAVSRNLLPALPLERKTASVIINIGRQKDARAANKKEDIISKGIAARNIIPTPRGGGPDPGPPVDGDNGGDPAPPFVGRISRLAGPGRYGPARTNEREDASLTARKRRLLVPTVGRDTEIQLERYKRQRTAGIAPNKVPLDLSVPRLQDISSAPVAQVRRIAARDDYGRELQAYEYGEASRFEEEEEEGGLGRFEEELMSLSRNELILKVMGLCTDTQLMKQLGMNGLLDAVSQYDKVGLVDILLDSARGEEQEEVEEEGEDFGYYS